MEKPAENSSAPGAGNLNGAGAPSAIRRALPLLVVAGALAIAWSAGWFDRISLSSLVANREWLAGFVADHRLTALFAYFVLYVALVSVSFPGASLLTMIAGFLFGGLVAGTVSVFAATVGASVIFLIARSSFGDILGRRAGAFAARMTDGFNRNAFNYLLTIRLTPVFPFWAINIVAALAGMRLAPYMAATFLGIIPGTFAYSYIGSGLDSVIAAQEAANPGCGASGACSIDPRALVTPQIVAAMFALAAISLLPVGIRWLRGRNAPSR